MKGTRRIEWLLLISASGLAGLLLTSGACMEAKSVSKQAGWSNLPATPGPYHFSWGGARRSASVPSQPEAPPGSLPSPDEELWVIQRPDEPATQPADDQPGTGALMTKTPDDKEIPLPLKHTDVKAAISGYIATVDVTQQYHNPFDGKIEAVYVFPLPHNAAVNEFVMTVGQRKIRGIIRDRKEAEQIYQDARNQGYVASLLTQERPNVFTQKVANIEPGKAIDINIRYFNTLTYADGRYEFVFPMVVGPRFNPPGSTAGVGSAPRDKQGSSGQSTEVTYLKPGERSGHDIALTLDIDAGVAIEKIDCLSHVVAVRKSSPEKATIVLSNLDAIPNKDFVLRYKVAGGTVKSAMLTHQDKRGGFFTLMVYPPEQLAALKRKPLELIFLLDCSGSMNGQPIAQVKNAIERALHRMERGDSFQIIRFSNDASALGPKPLEATPANVARGLTYLRSLESEGGTMAIEGVKAALDFPHDPNRLRFVCLMTDGFIGNEAEIIAETHKRLGASRIFSFGVGSSPNRYFMEGMAKIGRGAVAYLSLQDSSTQVVDVFFERISHPAMTDLKIDWGSLKVSEVYPERVPDLFVGRPVIVTGRFAGKGNSTVRITGKVGNETRDMTVSAHLDDASARHAAIPAVWARMKIADLSDWATSEPTKARIDLIKSVALEYDLLSAYTAFVAVDSLTRTAGDHGTTVQLPVPVPEGVRYETAVEGTTPSPNRAKPTTADREVQRVP